MLYSIGIDPDLHSTACAVLDQDRRVLYLGVARGSASNKGLDAILEQARQSVDVINGAVPDTVLREAFEIPASIIASIESPRYYHGSRKSNPQDLIHLAHVSGIFLAHLDRWGVKCSLVTPKDWKAEKEKAVSQASSYREMGWSYTVAKGEGYCVPELGPAYDRFNIRKGEWKHVGDAVGLALHGLRMAARPGRFDQAKSVAQRNRI